MAFAVVGPISAPQFASLLIGSRCDRLNAFFAPLVVVFKAVLLLFRNPMLMPARMPPVLPHFHLLEGVTYRTPIPFGSTVGSFSSQLPTLPPSLAHKGSILSERSRGSASCRLVGFA